MLKKISLLIFSFLIGCGNSHRTSGSSGQSSSPVSIHFDSYTWTSSYDSISRQDDIEIFIPTGYRTCPLVVFHRGRGFNFTDYDDVLTRISARGNLVVSVSDDLSFVSRTNPSAVNLEYDAIHPEKGMESASYAQQEVVSQITARVQNPSHFLFNAADSSKVYFLGHSRGGGSTEYCQSRNVPALGFIYYMAFNLQNYGLVLPSLAPTPSLIFAATNDQNLGFTGPANLINYMTGPSQLITIYGGNHDLIADAGFPYSDGPATISREEEHQIIVDNTLQFIK